MVGAKKKKEGNLLGKLDHENKMKQTQKNEKHDPESKDKTWV